MLAEMVTPGSKVADVGCDHGFLSIYLVQKGISPRVLAMDLRSGPLGAAREHIEACGLSAYIETRLSDGMQGLAVGEADTVVCAGMGGRLMERILTESMEKAVRLRELILQPQSEIREFRAFLRGVGFGILTEDAVYEEGKYYFAIKAVYRADNSGLIKDIDQAGLRRIYDEYGELLLENRHPVLRQYLLFKREMGEKILKSLEAGESGKAAGRLLEVRRELAGIQLALSRFEE